MEKKLKLMGHPSMLGEIGYFDDKMTLVFTSPYSNKDVTIMINPFIEYKNNQSKEYMELKITPQTKELVFDLENNSTQKINIADRNYEITLINIGKEKNDKNDDDFLTFEFLIKRN